MGKALLLGRRQEPHDLKDQGTGWDLKDTIPQADHPLLAGNKVFAWLLLSSSLASFMAQFYPPSQPLEQCPEHCQGWSWWALEMWEGSMPPPRALNSLLEAIRRPSKVSSGTGRLHTAWTPWNLPWGCELALPQRVVPEAMYPLPSLAILLPVATTEGSGWAWSDGHVFCSGPIFSGYFV